MDSNAIQQCGAGLGIQFVDGTYSKGDYAVLARVGDHIVLGVKLIVEHPHIGGEIRTFVGFRVRATLDPNNPTTVTDPSVFTAAFPGIAFDKADTVRASTHVGIALKKTADQQHLVLDALEEAGFFQKVIQWLWEYTPAGSGLYEPAQIEAYLRPLLELRFAEAMNPPAPLAENPEAIFGQPEVALKALADEFCPPEAPAPQETETEGAEASEAPQMVPFGPGGEPETLDDGAESEEPEAPDVPLSEYAAEPETPVDPELAGLAGATDPEEPIN